MQPPHLPPPLLPQRPPHLLHLRPPKPQQPPRLHLHHLLEPDLLIYRSQFIIVAEEAELNSVESDVAHDVVFARADFMQEVRRARGDVADRGGDDVGAADADGLVHEAHGDVCVWDVVGMWQKGKERDENFLEQIFLGSLVK